MQATLVSRPNRFLGIATLPSGETIEAHIGDRGRLIDILYPGAEVYVAKVDNPSRRTQFSLLCARGPALTPSGSRPLTCLDPAYANTLVGKLLAEKAIPELPPYGEEIRREVRHGHSRFDFGLTLHPTGKQLLLEVKSASAASGQAALFPDAPSERAARHCYELAELARAGKKTGEKTAIVLLAQRADVAEIRPHPVDPEFAVALREARTKGVLVLGVAFDVRLDGFYFAGSRPVHC